MHAHNGWQSKNFFLAGYFERAILALEKSRTSLEAKFESFFVQVRRLFSLLNAKGNGQLTRREAETGLRVVCKAMYATQPGGSSSAGTKGEPPSIRAYVQKQVSWLFSHAARASLDTESPRETRHAGLPSGSQPTSGKRGMEHFRRGDGPINPKRQFVNQPSQFISIQGFVECYKQLLR